MSSLCKARASVIWRVGHQRFRRGVRKGNNVGNGTVLHSFTGGADGGYPLAALVMDASGNLYGTTAFGGDDSCHTNGTPGCGVVFKITP